MNLRIVCLLTAIAYGSSASAQLSQPIGVTPTHTLVPRPSRAIADSARPVPYYAFPARLGLGILGSVAGAYAGAYTGASLHTDCHGDFCEFGNAIIGAAVGSSVGAALTASIPSYGNRCSMLQRTLLSSLGSTLGGVGGAFLGGASRNGLGVVGGYLSGAALGGAGMAMWC